MSSDGLAEDIKFLIAAATKAPCYDHDEAQSLGSGTPANYTIIFLSRRFGGNVRGGTRENPLRRLQVRVAAKTVSNARLLEDRIAALFEHDSHDVAGALLHFEFETQDAAFERDDSGYYTRLTDYTTAV